MFLSLECLRHCSYFRFLIVLHFLYDTKIFDVSTLKNKISKNKRWGNKRTNNVIMPLMLLFTNEPLYVSPSDLPDHLAAVRPLVAKISSRTASHISSSSQHQHQPPKTLPKPVLPQQPPPTLPKPSADAHPQQYPQPPQAPPTYPKPFTHSPQTQQRPQRFAQPLPKPFLQAPPPQTAPKPQGFPQALLKPQSHLLEPGEDPIGQSTLSGDLLSPTESADPLTDGMSSKQMSIKER